AVTVGENFRDPRIALEALSSVEQVAVVAAAHPLAATDTRALDAADLADHVQIVLADPTPLSRGRDFGVMSPQTCRVSTQDAKHALILAGAGWGRLPLWLVQRDLDEGRLARVRTRALRRNGAVASEVYLAHRVDAPPGPAACHLADALRRCARQGFRSARRAAGLPAGDHGRLAVQGAIGIAQLPDRGAGDPEVALVLGDAFAAVVVHIAVAPHPLQEA